MYTSCIFFDSLRPHPHPAPPLVPPTPNPPCCLNSQVVASGSSAAAVGPGGGSAATLQRSASKRGKKAPDVRIDFEVGGGEVPPAVLNLLLLLVASLLFGNTRRLISLMAVLLPAAGPTLSPCPNQTMVIHTINPLLPRPPSAGPSPQ